MHHRALVPSALLLTAVAAAQQAPEDRPSTCPTVSGAVAVRVQETPEAPADPAAGDCAACPRAGTTAKAAPVAFAVAQDDGLAHVALQEIEIELPEIDVDLEEILGKLDLGDLDLDLGDLEGAIAIQIGPDGEVRLLQNEESVEVDLEGGVTELPAPEAKLRELELKIESEGIAAEIAELAGRVQDEAREGTQEKTQRGYLGVQMNLEDGLNVVGVLPGSGAAEAGLRAGDRILEVNGESTTDDDITEYLQGLEAGETAEVVYARGDIRRRARIRLRALSAIQGGEPAEAQETEDALLEEFEVEAPEEEGGLIAVEADDFGELRGRVRDVVLRELDGEGRIAIGARAGDGESRVGESRVLRLGGEEDDDVRVFRLRAEEDEEDEEDAQDDGGHHFRGRVILKRIEDGEETVEEHEFGGDAHRHLPEHVRELLRKHGREHLGPDLRRKLRGHLKELREHAHLHEGEHRVRRLGGDAPRLRLRGILEDAGRGGRLRLGLGHDEDDEAEELLEELLEQVEELHERIDELQATIERLSRRRR